MKALVRCCLMGMAVFICGGTGFHLAQASAAESPGPSSRNTGLVITEIMYHPAGRDDGKILEFIEIYNSEPVAKDISGFRLSGEIDYVFAASTSIAPFQYIVVAAQPASMQTVYGISGVYGPFTGSLNNDGGTVRLRNNYDAVLLDVEYSDGSLWPFAADGAGHSLVLACPSYGENDVRAWAASARIGGSPQAQDPAPQAAGLVINEFAAHTDIIDPEHPDYDSNDWIELFNAGDSAVSTQYYYLSDDPNDLKKYALPTVSVSSGGFKYYDEITGFHNPLTSGFGLSMYGESIILSYLPGTSEDRVVDAIRFSAQQRDVTTGRTPDGSPGFKELEDPSPAASNTGLYIRDIVINEIMYNPISDDDDDEYIELYNKGQSPVDLSNWRFTDGIDFTFPSPTIVGAGQYLVVAKDAAKLTAKYSQLNYSNTIGDYSGTLSNSGEKITLAKPDDPLYPNEGFVIVDEVVYGTGRQWGDGWADGSGSSLELIDPQSHNRLAMNWASSDETGKGQWTTVEHTGILDHGRLQGGITINEVQIMLLARGECLIDDVEVFKAGESNRVTNPGFESGTTGWVIQGSHLPSVLETQESYSGSNCLRLIATSPGDIGANRVECDLSSALSVGDWVTIRAKVKWVRGSHLILLRLLGNYLECMGQMPVPQQLGTPGLVNTCRANAGPAIYDVSHSPIFPAAGQAAKVTARVHDSDGVSSINCIYRIDPSSSATSLAMNDSGTGGDVRAGDGLYTATIPGQSDNTLVAFRVAAMDQYATPATGVFPPGAPDERECLIRFGDGVASGEFNTYTFWMRGSDYAEWDARQPLSNLVLPGTFVYGDDRVCYFAGVRDRGSPLQRSTIPGEKGYMFKFDKEDMLLGSRAMAIDFQASWADATYLREKMIFWLADQIRTPFCATRFAHIYFNGVKKGTSPYEVLEPGVPEYLACFYPGQDNGNMFEISYWFEFDDSDPINDMFNQNADLGLYLTTGGEKKKARYRWNWEWKSTGPLSDDYQPLFDLVDVVNISDNDIYTRIVEDVVDLDGFLRGCAVRQIVEDPYGYGENKGENAYLYKPENGGWEVQIWDIDLAMQYATDITATPFNSGDPALQRMYNHPPFRRVYMDILREACYGPMESTRFNPVFDAWVTELTTNGMSSSTGSKPEVKSWISGRRSYLLSLLPSANFAITTMGGANFDTYDNLVEISGTAPLEVRTITVNGYSYYVNWTNVTEWTIRLALQEGANVLDFQGLDSRGNAVSGAADSITVTCTGTNESPVGNVIISEIMYHPAVARAEFVEIHNRSQTTTFDLSGWRLNGADFTFNGTVIEPGQYIVVVENTDAFYSTYGPHPAEGVFNGSLDNGGETLSLIIPGLVPAQDVIVDQVRYDDEAPWPTQADGGGPSLQLIDVSQDNARIGNWGVSLPDGATPGAVNSVPRTISLIPNLWINEVQSGNTAFQDNAGQTDPWIELVNLGGTSVNLEDMYLSDDPNNLTKWQFPSGAQLSGNGFKVVWADSDTGQTSGGYWHASFRLNIGGGALTLAMDDPNGIVVLDYLEYGPMLAGKSYGCYPDGDPFSRRVLFYATPGAANNGNTPAIEVYINEWMAANSTTIQDPADVAMGMGNPYDDWFELFNAGTETVDLSGYVLSDGSNNWTIPVGTVMAIGSFRIVWADEDTNQNGINQDLHASFKLSASGESIILRAPNDTVIDQVTFGAQTTDISQGRLPDGSANITTLLTSSPGAPNVVDEEEPQAPSNLTAQSAGSRVTLNWDDNSESDLAGYNVYRSITEGSGYVKQNAFLLGSSAYTDTSVSNGTTYYYVVTAVDYSANESVYSNEASATPVRDITAPAVPTGLVVSGNTASISVNWNNNTEPDLLGYNVYRSTTSGTGYVKQNILPLGPSDYMDSDVVSTETYYYVVTAIDTSDNESTYSAQQSATLSNVAPAFTIDPIIKADALEGAAYSASIASDATDANPGDTLTFSKLSGPGWLTVSSSGALSGMPSALNEGLNSFSVRVQDGHGGTDTAVLRITVVGVVTSNEITVCGSGGGLTTGFTGVRTFVATNTGSEGNYLVVAVVWESSASLNSMSFGDLQMTLLRQVTPGQTGKVAFYGIPLQAVTGLTGTVSMTYSSIPGQQPVYGYAFLNGVDVDTPVRSSAGLGLADGSGTGTIVLNYTPIASAGDFAMLAAYKNNVNTISVSPSDVNLQHSASGVSFTGMVAYDAALAGGSYTSTFTLSGGIVREVAGGVILAAVEGAFVPNPDINGDMEVNLLDFERLASAWLNSPCAEPAWCDDADIDHSGEVDIDDLMMIVINWLD